MIRTRLSSPLRWLSALMSALMLLAIASIIEAPLLMLTIPVIAGAFLLAPAVGVYKHDESPNLSANVTLKARYDAAGSSATGSAFRLTLVNHSPVAASDFRIRLLIPHSIVPREAGSRPLGDLHVGALGVHWFIDSMADAIAVTFRSAPRVSPSSVVVPADSELAIANLVLPKQRAGSVIHLDYQLSGGSVKATLSHLRLETDAP